MPTAHCGWAIDTSDAAKERTRRSPVAALHRSAVPASHRESSGEDYSRRLPIRHPRLLKRHRPRFPPSGLNPQHSATASSNVDFPQPFSPTKNVTRLRSWLVSSLQTTSNGRRYDLAYEGAGGTTRFVVEIDNVQWQATEDVPFAVTTGAMLPSTSSVPAPMIS